MSSRSNSVTSNKGEDAGVARTNSVASRRASMPVPRVSVSDPKMSGPILSAAISGSVESKPSISTDKSPSRRASVATGMLSAPFQKSTKESPRWRPYTFEAQQRNEDGSQRDPSPARVTDDSASPLSQRILEKGAFSLAMGLFVLLIAFAAGSVTRLLFKRDIGLLGFWGNQLFLIVLFCMDKCPDEEGRKQRMDKFTAFEILTLACQVVPALNAMRSGGAFTYSGLSFMVLMQVVLKVALMLGLGKVVDIAL